MSEDRYPPLPYSDWVECKTTLHLFTQIVGKIRLGLCARWNHWWHAPLYVSVRGLSTGSIPCAGGSFEIEFDLSAHVLNISAIGRAPSQISLQDKSVASFYAETMDALQAMGIEARILAKPFDPSKTQSDIPFAKDQAHSGYDAEAVHRYWQALVGIDAVFREFRGRFLGKCSPVHMFWHSFDLAVTRFSGKAVELPADADRVTREAYSQEVISAGFWPGDENMPEAAFYCYAAPEPEGLAEEPLRPSAAWWQEVGGGQMALYRYADFRSAEDPDADLMEFLQSSYEAAAERAAWPRKQLELAD